ncbi:MAG: helix-turn-helix transcriptional regulator [Oscillospiraceae bacterium]|nr:helix-turn-helix transcriptional regulator [Oscillospiraceae bacterium]
MTLGAKLQSLRKQSGMSQETLAGQLGVSRQAVSRWELDISLPETENIIKLAKIFNVSFDYLLGDGEQYINRNNNSKDKTYTANIVIFIVCMIIVFAFSLKLVQLLTIFITALPQMSLTELHTLVMICGLPAVGCVWVIGVAIIVARYFYKKM